VYVDKGNQIAVFDSGGNLLETIGLGAISSSSGVAFSAAPGPTESNVYATSNSKVVEFAAFHTPYAPIDNPIVVHGVHESGVHRYGDFQVTPDGQFAAFGSVVPQTEFDNGGHSVLYRYDVSGAGSLDCVSCNRTAARSEGDSKLASVGLSLLDDGRVFFNSVDALAPRDLNSRQDAYEWADGAQQLISPGTSPFNSSLLGVSADATDAYFFTKDTLVPQDQNGTLVKLYDARVDGGFLSLPAPVPCKASDECHGAGTEAPGPPEIRTIKGGKGNEASQPKCRRGKVRRHGKCVPKRRKGKRHQARKNGRRGSQGNS
jgi:hypothetical protein